MKQIIALILTLPILVGTANQNSDKETIQGTWEIVSIDSRHFEIKSGKIVIGPEKIRVEIPVPSVAGAHKLEIEEGTYKLDPSTSPKSIDIFFRNPESKEMEIIKVEAIYVIEGDSLKICSDSRSIARPKEFNVRANEIQDLRLVVAKRAKKKK